MNVYLVWVRFENGSDAVLKAYMYREAAERHVEHAKRVEWDSDGLSGSPSAMEVLGIADVWIEVLPVNE